MKKFKTLISQMEQHPRWSPVLQFVKFSIVGLSNTLIALGVYWLCYYIFHMHYQVSNFVAFVISVTNAYYWNSKYVFNKGEKRSVRQHARSYIKAFISYGITYLLSAGLLYIWVEKCSIPAGVAPLVNLIITIPLNYVLNKRWAFNNGDTSTAVRN